MLASCELNQAWQLRLLHQAGAHCGSRAHVSCISAVGVLTIRGGSSGLLIQHVLLERWCCGSGGPDVRAAGAAACAGCGAAPPPDGAGSLERLQAAHRACAQVPKLRRCPIPRTPVPLRMSTDAAHAAVAAACKQHKFYVLIDDPALQFSPTLTLYLSQLTS